MSYKSEARKLCVFMEAEEGRFSMKAEAVLLSSRKKRYVFNGAEAVRFSIGSDGFSMEAEAVRFSMEERTRKGALPLLFIKVKIGLHTPLLMLTLASAANRILCFQRPARVF